jgi:hypothetical protein
VVVVGADILMMSGALVRVFFVEFFSRVRCACALRRLGGRFFFPFLFLLLCFCCQLRGLSMAERVCLIWRAMVRAVAVAVGVGRKAGLVRSS